MSQLDWLISITAISVLFSSRAASDLLRSFGCGMGHSVGSVAATMMSFSRRSPHSISHRVEHRVEKVDERSDIVPLVEGRNDYSQFRPRCERAVLGLADGSEIIRSS